MALLMSDGVRQKLAGKHPPVTEKEILEAFENRKGKLLEDTRADNRTDPPTRWFIAPTDVGRLLKIAFILKQGEGVIIKTAYDPNSEELRIYKKYG